MRLSIKPTISLIGMTIFLLLIVSFFSSCKKEQVPDPSQVQVLYTMQEETMPHEGTWLQWPHQYQFGIQYRNELDPTWVAMTAALVTGENVHIIAYDQNEKDRITALLNNAAVPLTNVDFSIYPTDDVWVRDNGPIFVKDTNGNIAIQDWGFNGWGQKTDFFSGQPLQYANCDAVPSQIADDRAITLIDLNSTMINEGGSVVMDGNGTLMACKSSILNSNRNPGMTQEEAEAIFKENLGATHFIWLDGQAGLDITDQHIDGFAVFGNDSTIVTMDQVDLRDYDVLQTDIDKLYAASNKDGVPYNLVFVPLTQNNVRKTDGTNLGYKGSYINYIVSNDKVLVPNYNDPNDANANAIIQTIYPNRTVVGIDVRNLYESGGMVHCVTQQQPQ